MKTKILLIVLSLMAGAGLGLRAAPLGTSFTYQGRLNTPNGLAQSSYDFHFSLFDASGNGNQIGSTLTLPAVAVSNGLFTVTLDFGVGVFAGDARWLEIEVRPAGNGSFALLLPRQPVSPAAYAIYAQGAASAAVATTADAVAANSIATASLQNGSVTAAKIAGGQVVKSLNGLTDNLSLVAGANVTLNAGANSITISGSGNLSLPYSASLFLDGTTVGRSLLVLSNTATSGFSDGIGGFTASTDGSAVHGWATATSGHNHGVFGRANSPDGIAVRGENLAQDSRGFLGSAHEGVFGQSDENGVFGQSLASFDGTGVLGRYDGIGLQNGGNGVFGYNSSRGVGVLGVSEGGDGVSGRSNLAGHSGVFGYTDRPGGFGGVFVNAGSGTALVSAGPLDVRGEARMNDWNIFLRGPGDPNHGIGWHGVGKPWAGVEVDGPVVWGYAGGALGTGQGGQRIALSWDTTGEVRVPVLTITGGADLAEPFPLASDEIPPGAVVIIDEAEEGCLKLSERPYDTRVAGVVSGANGVKPGISLRQQGVLERGKNVALSGRVYVQADNSNGPIKPGDLLTTSAIPGQAMKVTDFAKAQGAILGKAMSSLAEGRGLVLVLVSLQ